MGLEVSGNKKPSGIAIQPNEDRALTSSEENVNDVALQKLEEAYFSVPQESEEEKTIREFEQIAREKIIETANQIVGGDVEQLLIQTKKKALQKTEELRQEVAQTVNDIVDDCKEIATEMKDNAIVVKKEALEKTEELGQIAKQSAEDIVDDMKDIAVELKEMAFEKGRELGGEMQQFLKNRANKVDGVVQRSLCNMGRKIDRFGSGFTPARSLFNLAFPPKTAPFETLKEIVGEEIPKKEEPDLSKYTDQFIEESLAKTEELLEQKPQETQGVEETIAPVLETPKTE